MKMCKSIFYVYLIILSTILLSACDSSTAIDLITKTSPFSTVTSTSSINPIHSSTTTILPIATSASTQIPVLPIVTDWSNYSSPRGISIDYPSNWEIETITNYDHPLFTLNTTFETSSYYHIYLDVFDRPIAEKSITDPHTWESTDHTYEILWEKPIVSGNLSGTEFVLNLYKTDDGPLNGKIQLIAVLYSEVYQLDIRLSSSIGKDTAKIAAVDGFNKVIPDRFYVFEHMLQSIYIEPSIAFVPYPAPIVGAPTLLPTITNTPEPTTPARLDSVEIDQRSLQSILEAVKYAFASGDVRVFEQLVEQDVRFGLAFSDGPGQILSKQEFIEAMSLRLPSRPVCLSYESYLGEIDILSIYTAGWEPFWNLSNTTGSTHLILTFSNQDTERKGLFLWNITVYEGEIPYAFGLPCE